MHPRLFRIILIEDNPDHAELVEEALCASGEPFQLEICSDINNFRKRAEAFSYDAILLDYHLPDGHSLNLLKEITADSDHPPVIFLSGADSEDIIRNVLESGASDFIIKSRSSLKTLPIIVKRSIIQKMEFQKDSEAPSLNPLVLTKHLEDSIRKISRISTTLSQNLKLGKMTALQMQDMNHFEEILDKTSQLLKSAKNSLTFRRSKLKSNSDKLPEI